MRNRHPFARLTILVVLFSCLAGAAAPSSSAKLSARAQAVGEALEKKLHEHYVRLFGETAHVSATVHVTAAAPAKGKGGKSIDMGYLPVPVDMEKLKSGSAQADEMLAVELVEVDLYIDKYVSAEVVASAQEVTKSVLKAYPSRVTIKRVESALPALTPPPTPKEATEKPNLLKDLPREWLYGLGAAAVLFTLGFLFMGFFIFRGLSSLGRSFESAATQRSGGQSVTITQPEDRAPLAAAMPAPALPPGATPLHDPKANLKLVEDILMESPRDLAAIFSSAAGDAAGVRWLLPRLKEEARAAFKSGTFSEDLLRQIDAASVSGKRDEEWVTWLQGFAERLILQKIRGASPLERYFGAEFFHFLARLPAARILDYVRTLDGNDAILGWRLVLELLSPENLKGVLAEASAAEWMLIAQAKMVSPADLGPVATRMSEALSADSGGSAAEVVPFPSEKLVEPILQLLREKALNEEDALLDELANRFPDLRMLVEKRYWTAGILGRVPQANLEGAFRNAPNETKAALLVFLPESVRKALENFLPEGNVRSVVLDEQRRLQSAPTAEKRKAQASARLFIESLRRQHEQGTFELNERPAGSPRRVA